MADCYPLKSLLAGSLTLFAVAAAQAQYKGGADDGHALSMVTGQPLGRNIFTGGTGDGSQVSLANSQPLGRNIFTGGVDDGSQVSLANSQPLGRNIFTGGVDDGSQVNLANSQPLGRNIFTGGVDDGSQVSTANSQPLGRNIFTGGVDDGWAMAFAANQALPLVLTDFSGRWQQQDALLFWKTATELNTASFELERSFDGSTFTKIHQVAAAGQSTAPRDYRYTDANIRSLLPAGITNIYYRLRSVDKDGAATYSGIVVLKTAGASEVQYAVFPNPARDVVTVTTSRLVDTEPSFIRLTDASGKVLALQRMTAARQQVTVAAFANGTYFLQLLTAGKVVYTQKIIIRK